jgi:hypothetical protein
MAGKHSFPTRIVEKFLSGNLSIILLLLAMLGGLAAFVLTPREEEPQIVVPIADVYVQMAGASAAEVERLISTLATAGTWSRSHGSTRAWWPAPIRPKAS